MARAVAVQQQLTALEHIHELWLRIMSSVVVAFIGGGLAYLYRANIINFLQRPLHQNLYYTSPMGSFQFVMQVCLLVGIILALPTLIYNLLRFIEPAFENSFSRFLLLSVLVSSIGLAAMGVAFGYYLTLPFALQFFNSVGTNAIHPLISVNEYFSFILGYLATFAVVFQLPLLLLFVNRVKPFKPGGLTRWRGKVYIGAFAISLIMPSSPDPVSQVSLAIPIIVLYELSIFLIWYVNRKHRRIERSATGKSSNAVAETQTDVACVCPAAIEDALVPEETEVGDMGFQLAMHPRTPIHKARHSLTIDGVYRTKKGEIPRKANYASLLRARKVELGQPMSRGNFISGGSNSRSRLITDIL